MTHSMLQTTAIKNRNKGWLDNSDIPPWVDINNVALDQFFTRSDIAKSCHKSLTEYMKSDGASNCHYKFVEPAVGEGAFYDLLPAKRRIGIDIMPLRPDFVEADFLSWQPVKNGYSYAVIGNPPFGYRAWLALAFVNHAAKFADFIGFILPMAFQSDGKGSPKFRVNGMKLVHTEFLPQDSFTDVNGKPVKVNALWQIWKRGENIKPIKKKCNSWLDLFTVDMRKERLCGQERMKEADYFLQRTFYKTPPDLVLDFSEVKYVCGYGLVIKKDKQKIIRVLNNTDWRKYSNLAAHNCRHISMYHIQKSLTDAGYIDD